MADLLRPSSLHAYTGQTNEHRENRRGQDWGRFRGRSAWLAVIAALATLSHVGSTAHAEVTTRTVDYQDGDTALQAYVASDDAVQGPRPGVLVCHAWWGQGDYAQRRARMLAEMGYTAVVLDMYGGATHTDDPAEAKKLAGPFYSDRAMFRRRATAGLELLQDQPDVDPDRIAAIGYCFGGTTVLELAYSGAELAGVVSFHGSLMPPQADSDDADNIAGEVLICHGQADPMMTLDKLATVIDALQTAEVPTTTAIYSGAVHAFTDPTTSGEMEGVAYQERADYASWEHMQSFLNRVFGGSEEQD